MSKYYNITTEVDGIKFDSRKEANRYKELKIMERGGLISHLRLQPRFDLQASFTDRNGIKHRAIEYVADFEYICKVQGHIVEDVKGFKTELYRLKKKLFLFKYPNFTLIEV